MQQILTVIPMAGKPTNTIQASYSSLPDGMIPINSKPVIGHILDDLLERGLKNVLILLNKDDTYTEKYVNLRYETKFKNIFCKYIKDGTHGLLGSIYFGFKEIDLNDYKGIFIYLGDTIYKGNLDFSNSFLTTSKNYKNSKLWCFIENNKFINKPINYKGNGRVLTGLYFFNDVKKFKNCLNLVIDGEMFLLLEEYFKGEKINLVDSEGWYDIGNIENYYKAKIDFLKVRSFNSIVFNEKYGTITKSSKNNEKIKQEINWYINMPYELKIFSPRLVNYKIGEKVSYEIEYYGYQSLGDLFLFGYLNENIWYGIIDKLFTTIKLFQKYKTIQPYSFFYDMYYNKTFDRLNKLKEDNFFKNLLDYEKIVINGKSYENILKFLKNLDKYIEYLYNENDICFIHGDFCLSNILYDVNNSIVKMIDPRGYFGELGVYGDIKYDLAKLRHSFSGYYDFIVSDLFKITNILGKSQGGGEL